LKFNKFISKKIRRKEKQLTDDNCNEILTTVEWGTLATIGADNFPYAVPVNFVYHNGNIYFHCAKTGHKLDNIQHCPNVSFNVVTDVLVIPLISQSDPEPENSQFKFKGFDTNFNSITIFGKATEIFDDEKNEVLKVFLKKFLKKDYAKYKEDGIRYIEKSINRTILIKIEIIHMTGKKGIK